MHEDVSPRPGFQLLTLTCITGTLTKVQNRDAGPLEAICCKPTNIEQNII